MKSSVECCHLWYVREDLLYGCDPIQGRRIVERRKFRPHVTLARFPQGAETGHHIAQFMASHSTFKAGPWIAEHFSLYSSRQGRSGSIYTEEAQYHLTF